MSINLITLRPGEKYRGNCWGPKSNQRTARMLAQAASYNPATLDAAELPGAMQETFEAVRACRAAGDWSGESRALRVLGRLITAAVTSVTASPATSATPPTDAAAAALLRLPKLPEVVYMNSTTLPDATP